MSCLGSLQLEPFLENSTVAHTHVSICQSPAAAWHGRAPSRSDFNSRSVSSEVNVSPLGIAGVITEEFHPDLWTRACARQHHFPARCAAAHSTKGTNAGNRCTQVGKT
eukprot:CAMPEP_0114693988 /NCGR_PEP_ID=MMETSP0191-20121206/69677_1 /TAXON_ID=126664 /ORGANISM="Sorites sp." /LENGTH=107 /DNA_ID=CAMNT_0001988319 /DNA_START=223 /DNA_END=543 /DNA_ORIENTATION=+